MSGTPEPHKRVNTSKHTYDRNQTFTYFMKKTQQQQHISLSLHILRLSHSFRWCLGHIRQRR